MDAGALPKLVGLLSDTNSEVRLNSIKALTLLAETPNGKMELQSSLTKVYKHVSKSERERELSFSLHTVGGANLGRQQ